MYIAKAPGSYRATLSKHTCMVKLSSVTHLEIASYIIWTNQQIQLVMVTEAMHFGNRQEQLE